MLVANKCDREDRKIESAEGRAIAEKHGFNFFETSAKSGLNVQEVFTSIAQTIVREKLPLMNQGGNLANAGGSAAGNNGNRNMQGNS